MGNVVRDSSSLFGGHICEHYGVHRIDDLTVTEITEVMAEYFNQKSARLDLMVAEALRSRLETGRASNGKGIL